MKLSLIIPHYNTYNLLEKLLKELSIQITDDVEIIVVDDSNDKRLDKFISSNIHIIHNSKRVGVSKARNVGINRSTGDYIGFIDSDDMISMDYIETLLNAIDKYDTDIINFNWYDMTTHIEHRKPHNPAVWKAIYKWDICPHFNEKLLYAEDVPFKHEIEKDIYTKTYLDKLIYFYNSNREGSLFWEMMKGNNK